MLLTVSPRKVSIHAPVKVRLYFLFQISYVFGFNSRTCEGATGRLGNVVGEHAVSIHAPVKVRPAFHRCTAPAEGFNSRTCEGATGPRKNKCIPYKFQFTHL